MNIETLRDLCRALPAVTEDIKWGHDLCFSVAGKLFCVAALDGPLSVSFKVRDDEFDEMANSPGMRPAPYVARYKWVLVEEINRLSRKEWTHYIKQSYDLVRAKLPKKVARQHGLLGLLALMASVAFLSIPASAQQTAMPQDVTRGFYSWYLHQLSREDANPLKQKTTALKYLTPRLYANAPRLIRRMDADVFICAQDWDKGWEKNFTVSTPQIKNGSATATVTLPSGEIDRIRINVTLIKTASGWRINKVACAN